MVEEEFTEWRRQSSRGVFGGTEEIGQWGETISWDGDEGLKALR